MLEGKKIFAILSTALFLGLSVNITHASPSISAVSGKFKNSEIISITGTGFGVNGPNIIVFDDFDDGSKAGELIDLIPTVGLWSGYVSGTWKPTYNSLARSGSFSGELSDVATGGTEAHAAGLFVNYPEVHEYFLSYSVQIPPGTYFPQKYASAPIGAFPSESALKFAWIWDYESNIVAGDDDKCLPTHTGYALMRTDGNDLNDSAGASSIRIHERTDTWWQWGAWNRYAFWGQADSVNPDTKAGKEWVQGIGEGVAQVVKTDTRPLFAGGTAPYRWTRLNIPGWIRETDISKPVHLLYDDIYFAVGPNAAARVEIGNNMIYESCTRLAIATPLTWSDTKVSVTVREGSFSDGEDVYLFIVDAENVYSAGFGPFSFGGDAVTPPQVPKKFIREVLN